ncbi:hypothetical protein [Flavisolibacter nicotianae]|uniref:hypothetical protein n=1 Tax=Flavisolibacter nicotianae TaxID=2364882 RepID=UPI000EB1B921|nr:hypothetical protein [Flavisolibacter nicotianae]
MKLLEYRLRPKKDFLMVAPWQELYKLTEYWKNELGFYQDELQFLENLLTVYEGPDTEAPEFRQLLSDTRIQLHNLMIQTDTHLAHLGKIIKEADNSDDLLFREEHDLLEDAINSFMAAFRQLKQRLFKAAENNMSLRANR